MKALCLSAAVLISVPCLVTPLASSAATETQPYNSTARSTLGELVDNPATKAILTRYLPEIVNSPHLSQARRLTLKACSLWHRSFLPTKSWPRSMTN